MKKRKSALSLLIVFALVLPMLTMRAFAIPTPEASWKIESTITLAPYDGFRFPYIVNMTQVVRQWNTAADKNLLQISQYTHWYSDGYPTDDGVSYIYSQDVGEGYVGETRTIVKRNLFSKDVVLESDINMNSYWAFSDGKKVDCFDFYSVFLHETGHVVGLAHDPMFEESVMYPYLDKNTIKRDLSEGDLQGLKYIYG